MTVAVLGGHGKTGRAVCHALGDREVGALPLGRADWPDPAAALAGCDAAYVIAPNLHPDEPAHVGDALVALAEAGVKVGKHDRTKPSLDAELESGDTVVFTNIRYRRHAVDGEKIAFKTVERPDDSIEELEAYYGPQYEDKLYQG